MFEQVAALMLPVATNLLLASCKGTLVIAFVLLCRKLFAAHLSARVRHCLWLMVLAALLLPVGFHMPIALRTGPTPGAAPAPVTPSEGADFMAPIVPTAVQPGAVANTSMPRFEATEAPASRISFQSWLAVLWGTGVVALAAITLRNLLRCRRVVAKATLVTGPALHLLSQCQALIGVRRSVQLLASSGIATPAVFGWRSPRLLLPAGLQEDLDEARLRHVFLHELAHVRRQDILVNWLATSTQILHWFNPVVWYGLRVMRSDMEQACDAKVLETLSPQEHADYGHTLIGVLDAFPGPAPANGLGIVESRDQLKERIMRIAKFSSRKARSPALATILLLGLASVAGTQPHVTSRGPASAIEIVPAASPRANAAILVTQAAQPAAASPPVAAPALKQPATVPGFTLAQASEAERAFSYISQIVQTGLDPNIASWLPIMGLYPKDPRTLLPGMKQMMGEYWQMLDRSTAALCRRKDVATIEVFTDVMREQGATLDAWRVQRWREYLASLSMQDKTPAQGAPRRFVMTNVREEAATLETFDQDQFNNFKEWRDGGCQVPATTASAADSIAETTAEISAAELADRRFGILNGLMNGEVSNDNSWQEITFDRLRIKPTDRPAFLASVMRMFADQVAFSARQRQEACMHGNDWDTAELYADAMMKRAAEDAAWRNQAVQELWASLSPAELLIDERGTVLAGQSSQNRNSPFDQRQYHLKKFETSFERIREARARSCGAESSRK